MTEQRNDFTIRFKDGPAHERDERIITAVEPGNRWFCDMRGTTWWRIDEAGPPDEDVAIWEYAEVSREPNPEGGTIIYMEVVSHTAAASA